jgi:penicillin-binding protein 2
MNFSSRKYVIILIFVFIGIVFIFRLFYLQVVDEHWKLEASKISERNITIYPSRGLVKDRNGMLLVANTPVYDLMVIPQKVKDIDTLAFCDLIGISMEDFLLKIEKARKPPNAPYKASIFERQINADDYAVIAEKLYKYPGFYGQSRTLRNYPEKTASHVLGYISEVTREDVENNKYYRSGDYIGSSGLEKIYEEELRGVKGIRSVLVDVFNIEKEGLYDSLAYSGKNLELGLDAELQAYGELLMQNKIGSIVAIDPETGEVLALVSSPGYDPNLLVGRVRNKHYKELVNDSLKPIFNRALMAKYPPGSTFKLLNALIGLQEGVVSPQTTFGCSMGYVVPGLRVGCHAHPSPVDLKYSIRTSCNAYYCNIFRRIIDSESTVEKGYIKWRKYLENFGLGDKTGIDLTSEAKGFVPPPEYYDKYYGKGRWKSLMIVSLAIGQGELLLTPIQMANMTATIANRGYYITPHVVRKIDDFNLTDSLMNEKKHSGIDRKHFELVVEGMYDVVHEPGGTARRTKIEGLDVCGKTGTAQNPHGEDHSIFTAFAPKENPKIAISVYVENGGFGSIWAAPIASLMIEKYINRTVERKELEESMMKGNLIQKKKS